MRPLYLTTDYKVCTIFIESLHIICIFRICDPLYLMVFFYFYLSIMKDIIMKLKDVQRTIQNIQSPTKKYAI